MAVYSVNAGLISSEAIDIRPDLEHSENVQTLITALFSITDVPLFPCVHGSSLFEKKTEAASLDRDMILVV